MRISDWSSDVCSSDLRVLGGDDAGAADTDARAAGYAEVICDTPEGHALVRPILELSARQTVAGSLDPELAQAYDALRREAGLEVDAALGDDAGQGRSEERRVGNACVSSCSHRLSPHLYTKRNNNCKTCNTN